MEETSCFTNEQREESTKATIVRLLTWIADWQLAAR